MVHTHTWMNRRTYRTWAHDSICHTLKIVNLDYIGLYSIEDHFDNSAENLRLKHIFVIPSMIRDSSRIITIQPIRYKNKPEIDTLNIQEFHKILVDWDLQDDLYKRFDFGF
jgi:hypothetical protein